MRLLPLLLFPIILSVQGVFAQTEEGEESQGAPPALVVTADVSEDEVRSTATFTGTAMPRQRSAVAAEVAGQVAAMPVRAGDRVEKGEILVRLRALPLGLELDEAQAELAEVEARLQKALDDSRRARELFEKGFISEEELQGRQTDLKALQGQLGSRRAEVRRLKDRLESTTIRAPFPGQVVEERTEVGQWVQAGDPVVELADLSEMEIRVPVPEGRIAKISRGEEAAVRFKALPDGEFTGTVTAVVPQADLAARTFPVEVTVPNADGRILAGMLAEVTFRLGRRHPALLVPKDALVPQPGGWGYLVKVEQGTAAIIPVRIIGSYGDRFAVESVGPPLSAGDEIVIRGNERLRPGQRVTTEPAQGEPGQ